MVLVGHSYGGIIITAAGDNAHVKSLVYVAAFQPDTGESLASLGDSLPPASKALRPSADGFLYLEPSLFHADFAADLPAAEADVMARSQVYLSVKAATAPAESPAWKSKPSFAIVATQDRAINPDLERSMYKRSHSQTTRSGQQPRRLHFATRRRRGGHRKGGQRRSLTTQAQRLDRCAAPTPAGGRMTRFSPEQNKAIVLEAFDTLFNQRDTQKAKRFWSPDYIQHSAHVPAGRDGLFGTISDAHNLRYEHQLAVAEGDYVLLHGRFSHIGQPANWIVVDICRLEDGVLVEHWDVIQDEVGKADSKSGRPMFGDEFPPTQAPSGD